ncbi:hypothetical protein ACKI2N_032510 [Cupriavidus sp. 30B13]|uniref:hypothetical protein n=1 Tax=Cupriavidus sp. 30B13 TaxID=3384241 RepID=UPI003B8F9AB3
MMTWPSGRDWLFSFKAFVAAMLALFIALYLGLPRRLVALRAMSYARMPLTEPGTGWWSASWHWTGSSASFPTAPRPPRARQA